MSSSEQRGFVFCVTFIIIFGALLAAVPVGLQGTEETPSTIIPVDPSILTDFTDKENYTKSAFSSIGAGLYTYDYSLGVRDWVCVTNNTVFQLAAKVYFWILWLGQLDYCKFTSTGGIDRGTTITLDEIETDADEGAIRYTLQFTGTGQSAGAFIFYWNTTAWPDIADAWDNDELYLLHGIGIESSATNDIGALIISLLLLQLPEVPPLINLFLAVPIWACIIYVLWFIIKEMIPFV